MTETTLPALPAAPEWSEATAAQAAPLAKLVASTRTPVPWRHPLRFAGWCVRMPFGLVVVGLLLAILAAIPGVNLVVLGALLDAESRVARSGRLRDGFPLAVVAPRLGAIVAGLIIWLAPLAWIAGLAADARLIDPGSGTDRRLHAFTAVVAPCVAVHLCLALARGGSFGCFFRPLKNLLWLLRELKSDRYWDRADAAVRGFLGELPLRPSMLWLGLRGYAAGFVWLVLPTALFAAMDKHVRGPGVLVTLFGGACLALVLSWAPFLQLRFALAGRLGAGFELGAVRRLFRYAPLRMSLAIVATYALSLPLYLATVAAPPRDALWMVAIVFIASIYPARLIVGWAYHAAARRQANDLPAPFYLRWLGRLTLAPLLAAYVFLLFFTQFIGEGGKAVLYQHHAVLLPTPF